METTKPRLSELNTDVLQSLDNDVVVRQAYVLGSRPARFSTPVASWLTGPHQENRPPQNSLIHVTSIRRAHKRVNKTWLAKIMKPSLMLWGPYVLY